MKEKELMSAVFGVIEHLTKSELTNIAKTLIYNYYAGSDLPTARERARDAVFRYAQCKSLPSLDEIRTKTKEQLARLEHLVLRMEYEAMKIDGTLPTPPAPAVTREGNIPPASSSPRRSPSRSSRSAHDPSRGKKSVTGRASTSAPRKKKRP